jgi:oligopeptidase B
MTARLGPLRDTLFEEMVGRVAEADESVGWRHGEFVYRTRQPAGVQYPQFCREAAGETQVLLDLNVLAADASYLALGVREVSPDDRLLAYSVDTDGDEVYELRVRDLETGADLPDRVPRSYYGCAWSADASTVLYVVHDEAYRPYQVMRHRLGTPAADDTLVYEETDERYFLSLTATRSGELIVLTSVSTNTSEVRLLATADAHAEPWLVAERRHGVDYHVEHVPGADGGELYIVTNDGAVEFRLMRSPLHGTPEQWEEFAPENPDERLVAVDAFRGHLVVTFRRDGYRLLRVIDLATGSHRDERAGIPAATVRLATAGDREPVNDPYDSETVTVVVESLVEPPAWWSINLATGARELRKRQPTPSYDSSQYRTERIAVPAEDGTPIPVTLAYRADTATDGTAPCLLYGYGAYEASMDPAYAPAVASLLDRGGVYAIAHVRGGGEGGRKWWLQGRMHNKRNTFTDFIAAADGLADRGFVDGARIVSRGASAGGLLQGAVLSIAPKRWRAVVAEVPFVDCVTTMLDPSLPLTAGEWEEWGDPRTPEDYDYMASYSPYDNVPLGPRPDLLATGSLHDPRVMVHEPAKWVARLRATRSDDSLTLLRAEVGSASHGGPSGRYDKLRYQAEIYAFVLDELEAAERRRSGDAVPQT